MSSDEEEEEEEQAIHTILQSIPRQEEKPYYTATSSPSTSNISNSMEHPSIDRFYPTYTGTTPMSLLSNHSSIGSSCIEQTYEEEEKEVSEWLYLLYLFNLINNIVTIIAITSIHIPSTSL